MLGNSCPPSRDRRSSRKANRRQRNSLGVLLDVDLSGGERLPIVEIPNAIRSRFCDRAVSQEMSLDGVDMEVWGNSLVSSRNTLGHEQGTRDDAPVVETPHWLRVDIASLYR